MTLQPAAHLAVLLVASQLLAPAVWAGQLSGTARLQQPIALPPDAVLEVVLIDAAIADAPAGVLVRTKISPPGQGPLGQSPLGRLPASWRGELPNAGGSTLWQVDLAADGSYQLRQTWLNRPAPNTFDDIGRWRLEPSGQRLVLRGGREAPIFLQPLEGGAVLRKLDLEGQPIRSGHNDRLTRLTVPEPISPRLFLAGLFRLLPQGPTMQLCITGQRLPVALEGDYKRLLQAYRSAVPASGPSQPLLVSLKGLISQRPVAQTDQGSRRALVVEAFGRVHPGKGCPQPQMASTPAATTPVESDEKPATAHGLEAAGAAGTKWPDPDQSAGPATGIAAGHWQRAPQRQQRLQSAAGGLPAGWRPAALLATGEHQDGLRCRGDGLRAAVPKSTGSGEAVEY